MKCKVKKEIALSLVLLLVVGMAGNVKGLGNSENGVFSVLSYGAVGNGSHDDTAGVQAAIDAAASYGSDHYNSDTDTGHGTVYFPTGTYKIDNYIQLKSNVEIVLDDSATIVNGINKVGLPSIIFMSGPYIDNDHISVWAPIENVVLRGGTVDLNGKLNSAGTQCQNLPNIGSSGAFALTHSSNVRIEDVVFLDSYKGHVMQLCACDGVLVRGCSFKGQAIPSTLSDGYMINLETIQIEPSTEGGFPYAPLNADGTASTNIVVESCYFGKSSLCGEPIVAIGTHNQVSYTEKCNHITVKNNVFDNMTYAGVRFCGYEDVVIKDNIFIKKDAAQSVNHRNASFLINAYCYYKNNNDDTGLKDPNERIEIDGNSFTIFDPGTRAIRVAKDVDDSDPTGSVVDITITNNTVVNASVGSEDVGINAQKIANNLIVSNNVVSGGYRGIEVKNCDGSITMQSNVVSDTEYQQVRFIQCGTNRNISFFTHGPGTINVATTQGRYYFTAVPNSGHQFIAYFTENALANQLTPNPSLDYAYNRPDSISRHPLFE